MRKQKKIKQINLPMKFNPGLSKFEPELPVRKTKNRLKAKRNWWAFWCIIILITILAIEILYFLLRKL